jgi:hypothetical protein
MNDSTVARTYAETRNKNATPQAAPYEEQTSALQGMSTAPGVTTTATVFGCALAVAAMRTSASLSSERL